MNEPHRAVLWSKDSKTSWTSPLSTNGRVASSGDGSKRKRGAEVRRKARTQENARRRSQEKGEETPRRTTDAPTMDAIRPKSSPESLPQDHGSHHTSQLTLASHMVPWHPERDECVERGRRTTQPHLPGTTTLRLQVVNGTRRSSEGQQEEEAVETVEAKTHTEVSTQRSIKQFFR